MALPALEVDRLRAELSDPTVRKHELWLERAVRNVRTAYEAGVIEADDHHDLLGGLHSLLGRHEEAIRHGAEAVRLNPAYTDYRHNLALSLGRAGRLTEAIAELRALVVRQPDDIYALYVLAASHAAVAEWASARRAFAQLARVADPSLPRDLWFQAHAAALVGRWEASAAAFARLLAVRAGDGTQAVDRDAVGYLVACLDDRARLETLPEVPPEVTEAVQRVLLARSGPPAPLAADNAPDDDAIATLHAFAPARARANRELPDDDG